MSQINSLGDVLTSRFALLRADGMAFSSAAQEMKRSTEEEHAAAIGDVDKFISVKQEEYRSDITNL